jgi:DNA-nicking Smr family endonuclease
MRELDLHGIRTNDVEIMVDQFLYVNRNNLPVKIITGNSYSMRKIVKDYALHIGYTIHEPRYSELIVY